MKLDGMKKLAGDFMSSLASLVKVILMSKMAFPSGGEGKEKAIVIMGNGPSLRKTIDEKIDRLESNDLMAVNFAANTPDFLRLRPKYYVLADGHFFNGADRDANVRKLWENISAVTWKMTLLIPLKYIHFAKVFLMNSGNVELQGFNLTPIEGFGWVKRILFNLGAGMPRPRNVMIPAIMCAIRLGYGKIYLCGADHTWTKTLDVDDENFVISIQPHFYKDNKIEADRVRETYRGIKLHEVLESMTVAFRSYWEIADYAGKKGVEIINATPGSMIDAFPKKEIS